MQAGSFTIQNPVGLHARPAALFVQTAAKFKSKIMVKNATRNTPAVDAKSILSVMTLGVSQGHTIEVTTEGEDEQPAYETLARLIESDFTEAENKKAD